MAERTRMGKREKSGNQLKIQVDSHSQALKGLRSGASAWGTAPSSPRSIQFNAGTRWRSQTDIDSGFAPSAAFGSKAVRPSESRLQRQAMASPIVACKRRRYNGKPSAAAERSKPM